MKQVSMPCSLLATVLVLASTPVGLRAQSENLLATKTSNESIEALHIPAEAPAAQSVKRAVQVSQPILQPGTLKMAGQVPAKLWSTLSIPSDPPRSNRTSWIRVGSGSLPLADTLQPDATQKYTSTPTVLRIYFGHRP